MQAEFPCTYIWQDKDGQEQRYEGTIEAEVKPEKVHVEIVWVSPSVPTSTLQKPQ
jgi:hypothetical protein